MNTPNFVTVLSGVTLATSGMVFGLCLPSSAAQLWNWSYSGGGSIGGNGTFTTDDGPSPYIITDITGTSEGNTVLDSIFPRGRISFSREFYCNTGPGTLNNSRTL